MNLLFLTKGLARYRKNLIDGMGDRLSPEDQLMVATYSDKAGLWEVDWDRLVTESSRITYREFPTVDARSLFMGLLHRIFKQRTLHAKGDAARIEQMSLDIVAIQEFSWPMIKVAIYCKLAHIPCIVCTDIGMDSNWGTQFFLKTRLIHLFASWLTIGVAAHSAAARNPVSARWRPNLFIPHTVDIRTIQPGAGSDGNPVKLLMVASFTETKGHDLLLEAARLLVNQGITNFKFHFVGTHDPTWLAELIKEKELSPYFEILGVLKGEALFEEFRNSDVFVLSSRGDTFGVVVHEASAFGMPLIISKFAGASSVLVDEGKNGYVINPYESRQFAEKLGLLIQHPELRESFRQRSRELGEEFCAHRLGSTLLDWFKEFAC